MRAALISLLFVCLAAGGFIVTAVNPFIFPTPSNNTYYNSELLPAVNNGTFDWNNANERQQIIAEGLNENIFSVTSWGWLKDPIIDYYNSDAGTRALVNAVISVLVIIGGVIITYAIIQIITQFANPLSS